MNIQDAVPDTWGTLYVNDGTCLDTRLGSFFKHDSVGITLWKVIKDLKEEMWRRHRSHLNERARDSARYASTKKAEPKLVEHSNRRVSDTSARSSLGTRAASRRLMCFVLTRRNVLCFQPYSFIAQTSPQRDGHPSSNYVLRCCAHSNALWSLSVSVALPKIPQRQSVSQRCFVSS